MVNFDHKVVNVQNINSILLIELYKTQEIANKQRADTDVSQNLLGMMLPSHIMEDIEAGRKPDPQSFSQVTLFFTGYYI